MRAYYRMLSGLDGAIARVLGTLKKQGLAENTIIVYSADNGYYMGDRGFAGKWSHYEQSLRVPLIVYDPRDKKSAGRVVDDLAMNLDLPVTFLSWAGVDVPAHYQGLDLAPIIRGDDPGQWRTDMFHEHVGLRPHISWEGVRNKRYKYARYFDQENYEFLHDLARDPDELENLADDPDYKAILANLRHRTDDLVAGYGGPLEPYVANPRKR